ncbi:CarD family transcriptional regulator [Desulfurobacterium atlanticum]|uniref:Transcriptional regulator, CarD family n=1 Tax=Desulfurobacterium atlanticum TaxID=240169 RepID=A0A238Y4N9_9BACT|nr:CarD family transcriptional regulator [Desulfurobacterium atlanticum]SNR65279.1 transcriptional regulator, CarD family [Desulfurobacterium atlanticum]
MIKVGDKVAYPPHGVGVVEGEEKRQIGDKKIIFFRIKILGKNMSVLVPETVIETSGIRPVLSKEEVEEIFHFLAEVPSDISNKWTVRHRLNVDRIKTGEIKELAIVVRNLSYRTKDKELSYSEKRMFEDAFEKLSEEIALSLGKDIKEIKKKIRKILKEVKSK